MKKKKGLNIKISTIILLSLVVLCLGAINIYQYKKDHISFLDSITILGNEFKLTPGIYVYEFTIDNPKIKKDASGTGCEETYTYEVSKSFKRSYDNSSSISYFVAGETSADFRLSFTKDDKKVAYYYFIVNFSTPLEVDEGC